jgi:hypothetical protein
VIDLLTHGQIEEVIAAIERLPAIAPPQGKSRSIPEIEGDYFRTNAERMRYPSFAHRECMWAVALPKPLAKWWFPPVPNEQACVGLLLAWMPFSLCAQLS